MPSSNMSFGGLSIVDRSLPKSRMASQMAQEAAQREIRKRIEAGQLRREDEVGIKREWKDIYRLEYYKYYAILAQQEQPSERIVTKVVQNPAATKFFDRHAAISFSKYNTLLMVNPKCVSENGLDFPIEDEGISLETKEAFLIDWPGPLDRPGDQLIKRKTTDYIEKMWQHDSQRKIRYHTESSNDQRKIILRLLIEFLHRNGSLDASSITRLLLKTEQTEIHKDEGNRKPLETLQKYLLLGKRSEAIKFAKTRKLWDHAQCLAFLDKYQPPNTSKYAKDKNVLKEDSIVQLNNEYISSIDSEILNTVYRALLNRILQSDPESVHIVKHPDVGNDDYEFAMLSANDCEMDFDQSNEIFKLVNAIKRAPTISVLSDSHLISLGLPTIDTDDTMEDMSYRSNISFKQDDTYASRTLTISNIDMLILNEIWEYCLNLARGTTDPASYDYIVNLIPFKLVFASTLLDLGLHSMFACYLASIRNALAKLKLQPHLERDPFYDWETIERSAEVLSNVWDIYSKRSDFALHQHGAESYESTTMAAALLGATDTIGAVGGAALPPPAFDTPFQHESHANHQMPLHNNHATDYMDSPATQNDYASLPPPHHQGESAFSLNQNFPPIRAPYLGYSNIPPSFGQQLPPPTIPEEPVNDFSPEVEPSEPVNVFNPEPEPESMEPVQQYKTMTSSSPVDDKRNSYNSAMLADSFNAFSPINDDLPRHELSGRHHEQAQPPPPLPPPMLASSSQRPNTSNNVRQEPPPRREVSGGGGGGGGGGGSGSGSSKAIGNASGDRSKATDESQQPGFIANIAGSVRAFLPKSNSKQMILPDDSSKSIVYDHDRGTWVDTTKPEGEEIDDYNEPPPVAAPIMSAPPTYSFAPKSAKTRYPKTQFPGA